MRPQGSPALGCAARVAHLLDVLELEARGCLHLRVEVCVEPPAQLLVPAAQDLREVVGRLAANVLAAQVARQGRGLRAEAPAPEVGHPRHECIMMPLLGRSRGGWQERRSGRHFRAHFLSKHVQAAHGRDRMQRVQRVLRVRAPGGHGGQDAHEPPRVREALRQHPSKGRGPVRDVWAPRGRLPGSRSGRALRLGGGDGAEALLEGVE
mmetsp:Transcript_19157/g.51578  ORF Transcript_19157/g.51578 Transcript_19157/m.51578 type:complete len:208 (-) Transcript_19157:1116-1739(-)